MPKNPGSICLDRRSSVCRALSDHVIAKDITQRPDAWNTPLGGLVGGVVPFTSIRVGVYLSGYAYCHSGAASGVVVKDINTGGLRSRPGRYAGRGVGVGGCQIRVRR